jgi:hypothetical protein
MNEIWTAVIGLLSAVSGMVLGWTGFSRASRQSASENGKVQGTFQSDMDYIKRGVDDIRIDLKAQGKEINQLSVRMATVEESAKSAHKRIDRLEETKHED